MICNAGLTLIKKIEKIIILKIATSNSIKLAVANKIIDVCINVATTFEERAKALLF